MSITIQSPFKSTPRISRAGFIAVLERVGSFDSTPLWGNYPRSERPEIAGDIYDDLADNGHDPAVFLGIAGKEHTFGSNLDSVLGRNNTRSWTNARQVRHPDVQGEIITDSYRRSQYVKYGDVRDSVRDGWYRVDDPTFAYVGLTTIAEIIAVWAPADDQNDPAGYAQTMARWINEWAAEFPPEEEPDMSVAERYGISDLIDSRHHLATRSSGGPSTRRSLSEKRGKVVVHYAGGAQNLNNTDLQLWQSYANWHVRDNAFGQGYAGNGIMYHVGISRDGSKHLLYDIEVDRWHCGSWPENGTHLSINLPIGGNQRATSAQLKALAEVVNDWVGDRNRNNVIGHQEVDWTSCPGTLMADFVLKYREGLMTTEQGKHFPQTDCYIGGGFWTFYSANGGFGFFGLPRTNEFQATVDNVERTVQIMERAAIAWYPEDKPHGVPPGHPMHVRMLTIQEAQKVWEQAEEQGAF